jgi:iron(III) transport system permease protein
MATLIVATSTIICVVYAVFTRFIVTRTQRWRAASMM